MPLPPLPHPYLKYFYSGSTWVLAVLAILIWHESVEAIVYFSVLYGLTALPLCYFTFNTSSKFKLQNCFSLWFYQAIALSTCMLFAALWFNQFPTYGFYRNHFILNHLSLIFFISTLVLANILILLVSTAQQNNNEVSVLPLYKDAHPSARSLTYKHATFRRSLMLTGLMLFLLPCFYFLTLLKINLLAIVVSCIICIYAVRSEFIYTLLQKGIKQQQFSFLFFLVILFIVIAMLSLLFNWFISPVFPFSPLSFFPMGSDAPLIIFWGYALCVVIPLSFLLAPKLLKLSPIAILLTCIFNPFIWLMLMVDLEFNLLTLLSHLSKEAIIFTALFSLITSAWWLSSKTLAKLNVQFLYSPKQYRGGPMPRLFVQSHLAFAILLIACLALKALFWIQVEFLCWAAWVMVSGSMWTGFFFTHFRKKVEEGLTPTKVGAELSKD